MRQIDGVLHDVPLCGQIRGHIDRGIRDQQRLGVSRHVEHVDMAHPPLCAQPEHWIKDGLHQLVRMQRTFHQRRDRSVPDERDRSRRCRMAVRGVDEPIGVKAASRRLCRGLNLGSGSDQHRRDHALVCGIKRRHQRQRIAGMHDCRLDRCHRCHRRDQSRVLRTGARAAAPSAAGHGDAAPCRAGR